MNPYAKYLGERDARAVIAETAGHLAVLAGRLGPEGLRRSPAPGKWSAAEIFCHLADCEVVFAYRLRQALAEPHHVIQPFDQDVWAAGYGTMDGGEALAVFSAVRRWNVALFARMTAADLDRVLTHPERGQMTVRTVLETMAGHDLNHLGQVERIASGAGASAGQS
jgi:DinB superfamily